MNYKNGKKNSKLSLTDCGKIIGNNFNEISVNDFFEKLEQNIESDLYNVFYDKKNKVYIVTFDGEDYVLKLDKKIMEKDALGNYTKITRKLNLLIKKEKHINLQNLFDNIGKDYYVMWAHNIVDDLSFFIEEDLCISYDYVEKLIFTFAGAYSVITIFLLITAMFNLPHLIMEILIYLIAGGAFSYFILPYVILVLCILITYPINIITVLFKNIFKYTKNKWLINQKIKALSSKNMIDQIQIKSTTSRQLDELEKADIKIGDKSSVQVVISEISEKLAYINIDDRKRIEKKLIKILKEFMIKVKELEKKSNGKNSNLQVNNDKINLEKELLRNLYEIEKELLEIMKRNFENEQNMQSVESTETIKESVPTSLYTEEDTDLSTGGRAYSKKLKS